MNGRQIFIVGAPLLLLAASALAHLPILTPARPWGAVGQELPVVFTFGHPFEVEAAPAARPVRFTVLPPTRPPIDLLPQLDGAAKERPEWRGAFTPEERGDHIVALALPPKEHGGETVQDFVKLVVHVPAVQRGWDRVVGDPLEVVPLTRPYGLPAGGAFRAEVLADGRPLAGCEVQVEYKNAAPPAPLPPEPYVTRVERTDRSGAFAATLERAGWWIVCASRATPQGTQRASLWLFVGPVD